MTNWSELFPPFGLAIRSGDLELRAMTPADIPDVLDLAVRGVARDDTGYPFVTNWALLEPEALRQNSTRFYFATWAAMSPEAWSLPIVVRHQDNIVGCQDLITRDFPVSRVAVTGSWLRREFQGQGLGTRMRRLACAFAFDALGAAQCRTEAYGDNPLSQRVSEKVGYERFDDEPTSRLGEPAVLVHYRLRAEDFVQPAERVEYERVEEFRRFVGLVD